MFQKKRGKKMLWIEKLLIPALLVIITGLSGYMTTALSQAKKINNANAKGTMLLLRRQIVEAHARFCKRGEPMSHFDYNDVTEIHNAYKELGGNGLTDKMFEDLQGVDLKEG